MIITEQSMYIGALVCLLCASLLPLIFSVGPLQRFARKVALALAAVGALSAILFAIRVLLYEDMLRLDLLRISSIVGLSVDIDLLAGFFVFIIGIVALPVVIYSFSYSEHFQSGMSKNLFVSLMSFFILSLVLVVSASDMFSFLFFWELMSVSSFLLVMFDYHSPKCRKAGLFYFVMTQLSTAFLLLAFLVIYSAGGSLSLAIPPSLSPWISGLVFLSLMFGFGTKAGVIPFHKWLPYAHPASPSPISALMSGVMIKVAVYGLLRFLIPFQSPSLWWGVVVLVFGTVSAWLGVIYALKEHDLKRLLAYHSIENIGIIWMGIGLFLVFSFFHLTALAYLGLAAALFHTLNHAIFKSLLFLSAGGVIQSAHTQNIEELGGLVKTMPFSAVFFLVGAVAISAIPPLNGFVSEFMLFQALFSSNQVGDPWLQVLLLVCLSFLAMTSALAAACFVKAFASVFLALPRSDEARSASEVPFPMLAGQAILALLCVVFGVFSLQLFSLVGQRFGIGFDLPDLLSLTAVMIVICFAVLLLLRFFASSRTRVGETWGCGMSRQTPKMEYTASGFSQPIVEIFSFIYRPKKVNSRSYHDSCQADFSEGEAEIHMLKFFEEYVYLPLARVIRLVSSWFYRWQNVVDIDSFVFFGFLSILALIVITGVWA